MICAEYQPFIRLTTEAIDKERIGLALVGFAKNEAFFPEKPVDEMDVRIGATHCDSFPLARENLFLTNSLNFSFVRN